MYQLTTFGVHKTFGLSSSRFMIRLHPRQRHGKGPFFHFFPYGYLFNGLLSNPNHDHIQNLFLWEVSVPTYHFWVHKTVGNLSNMVMSMIHHT